MKYKNRADLLIAAGNSTREQERWNIKPEGRCFGLKHSLDSSMFADEADWEFPIVVVEGKPVYVGDDLFDLLDNKFIVAGLTIGGAILKYKNVYGGPPFETIAVSRHLHVVQK
jgi:hypothetical protein